MTRSPDFTSSSEAPSRFAAVVFRFFVRFTVTGIARKFHPYSLGIRLRFCRHIAVQSHLLFTCASKFSHNRYRSQMGKSRVGLVTFALFVGVRGCVWFVFSDTLIA